jgi:hypothetical protein
MRTSAIAILAAAVFAVVSAAAAPTASAQQAEHPLAPPMPYKPVPVTLPQPVNDGTYNAFRQQLADIAQKKDHAALAAIVAQNFFWVPEDQDIADKRKSGIENLARAIDLDGPDAPGWEALTAYANETSADPLPDPQRKGVLCAPGQPSFDEKAAMELAAATKTDPGEWGYPARNGMEVRSGPEDQAPVAERLGLHLVRVYPDDTPAGAVHGDVIRIVTPSGKLGFVPIDLILPLATDQVCYGKDGDAWKIAGVIGGAAPGR